jgi:hypothetical protein
VLYDKNYFSYNLPGLNRRTVRVPIEKAYEIPVKIKLIGYSPELLSATLFVASLLFVSGAVAQNVGIGVSSPQSKLSVNGTTSSGGLAIGDATYTSTAGTVAPTNGALIQGNTGIGLQKPQVPLHVDGEVYVSPGGVTGSFWNGTANMDGVQLEPGGFIGVQRAGGADLVLSKGAAYTNTWLEQFVFNGTVVGTIQVNASANPTGVTYGTTSDQRLKENIRPTAKGLNAVMKIQVRDYNFKSKPGTNETGFIAQQLYTVLPDAVTVGGENAAKKPWTVDYGRVTPLLTRAIQEQEVEIDVLKEQNGKQDATIIAQQAKIATLETEVASLKASNEKLAAMSSEVEALKKAVAAIQSKDSNSVRTVVLNK